MTLRLITGAANSGKTGEVLAEALSAAAAGRSPELVVPSSAIAHRLENELATKRVLGVRVSTLSQFVFDLWAVYGDGRRIVSPYARDSIIAELVAAGVERPLEAVAHTPGFPRLVSRLVGRCAPASRGDLSHGGNVEGAIADLVARYESEISRSGLIERVRAQETLGESSIRLPGPVGVLHHDMLTRESTSFLAALARDNSVTVAITWEAEQAATRANDPVVAELSAIADEHLRMACPGADTEIARLARTLYRGPAGLLGSGRVVMGTASGIEGEAALVAKVVADAMREHTLPERIAIVFPDLTERIGSLGAALRAEDIPAEFATSVPFSVTPFGRAYLGLVALASGAGGREEALTFSDSPFSGADVVAVQGLDGEWRRGRVARSSVFLRSLRGLGEPVRTSVELAEAACRRPLSADSLGKWLGLAENLLRAGNGGSRGAANRRETQDARAFAAVSAALSAMGEAPIPLRVPGVIRALRRVRVRSATHETTGRVQIADFETVDARRFDVVIVGGLTEDEMSTATSDSSELGYGGLSQSLGVGDSADLARLQFYSLVTRARERLVLIRQEAKDDGSAARASSLWEDVLEAYRSPAEESEEGELGEHLPRERTDGSQIEWSAPALTRGRRALRQRAGERDVRVGDAVRSRIVSEDVLALLGAARTYTPTEIETYLECPYRWFHERVLRPDDIDAEFDNREQGIRAHRLMAAFYRRVAEDGSRRRVTPQSVDEALALLDEVAEEEMSRLPSPETLAEELAVARMLSNVRAVVSADATLLPAFVPAHSEIAFGETTPFEFAGQVFRGRIDRIDTSASSMFVTDYKSARDVPGLPRLQADNKVQLVIYAVAAQELLGLPVAGAAYRSMASGSLRGFWRSDLLDDVPPGGSTDDAVDAEGYAELVSQAAEKVAEAVHGMTAGHIPREPATREACTYCVIRDLCEGSGR